MKDILEDINDFINSKFDVGFVHHPYRNDIYDEANACINGKRDNKVIVGEQIAVYKAENFQCYDLIESNYMVLNLRSEKSTGPLTHTFLFPCLTFNLPILIFSRSSYTW